MTNLIVGLGDGLPAARHFATAADRTIVEANGIDDVLGTIKDAADGSLIVSGGSALTSRDLCRFARAASAVATPMGFIAGWHAGDALRHARKMLGYNWMAGRDVLYWSLTDLPGLVPGRFAGTELLRSDGSDLLRQLSEPRHATALASHGNGIDFLLKGSFLCSMLDDDLPAEAPFRPCGHGSGPCVHSKNVNGRLVEPSRYRPSEIAADVIILATCHGMLARGSLCDSARSLGAALIRSRWAGALITTYTDVQGENWQPLVALGMLQAGHRLGDICTELNRLTQGSDGDTPWLLFGDPTLTFAARRQEPRLPAGAPSAVRLQPGMNLLQLPSAEPTLVTVEAAGTGQASRVGFQQVPGAGTLVAVHYADQPVDLRLTAEAAERSVSFDSLRSVRSTVEQLAFTRSVLDKAAKEPATAELVADGSLRSLVSTSLSQHIEHVTYSSSYELASALSSAGGLSPGELLERENWVRLNSALALFLAAYQQRDSPTTCFGTPRGTVLPAESECPYCGMVVAQRESRDAGSGLVRRVGWCSGCAFLGNTSSAVDAITIEGPGAVRAGDRREYTLVFDGPPVTGWSVVHACLRMQRTPWAATGEGPLGEVIVQRGEPLAPLKLLIRVRPDVPVGVHYLVAAIAAQGDLWICRRPLFVEAPAD
ncbi:hypothetical protein [Nonomuraea sp. NPDC052265]|uniref:hypothetical protein n=1 Tax=Nonomuraea sp. NPDC052265 TaxID=3364374 RepID=UPI0037C616B9